MASARVVLSSLLIGAPLCGAIASSACGTSTFSGTTVDAASDAASEDAATEASLSDGGGPFCPLLSPAPYFCADFDQSTITYAYLNGESRALFDFAGDGGTLDAGASDDSPPFELVSALAGAAANSVAQLDSHDQIPPTKGVVTYHLDLDFKIESIDKLDSNTAMTIFNLDVTGPGIGLNDGAPPLSSSVDCELFGNNVQMSTGGAPITFGGIPTPGRWVHAHLDFVVQGVARSSAEIDGITRELGVIATDFSTTTAPRIRLGLASAAADQTLSVSFDNVEVTYDTSDAGDGG